ncbi:MAG: hypothetical protein U5K27_04680 [Desulfotignum sp.]|nr:hypothetical protein [Desulfotignum sp.]
MILQTGWDFLNIIGLCWIQLVRILRVNILTHNSLCSGERKADVINIQLPEEHLITFQTEGKLYDRMQKLYEEHQNMSKVVEKMKK